MMRWLLLLNLLLSIQGVGVGRSQVWKRRTKSQPLLLKMMRELDLFRPHGREGRRKTAGCAGSAGCMGAVDGNAVVAVPIRVCPVAEERVRRSGMAESSSHLCGWKRGLMIRIHAHAHVHCL
jgi:hypothetical protein